MRRSHRSLPGLWHLAWRAEVMARPKLMGGQETLGTGGLSAAPRGGSMTAAKDWTQAHANGADKLDAADRILAKVNKVHPRPNWREMVFSALDLQRKEFNPISYVVTGLIPDGLSILVGRPKIGKSWLALEIVLAVASKDGTCLGGRKVEHGNVLYCACEDSERRLQSRITKLIGVHKKEWPEAL